MSANLTPKSLPALIAESFAFLSLNFRKLLLFFILPSLPVFFSGIVIQSGLPFVKSGNAKPFTLNIRQNKGESFLIYGKKVARLQKNAAGISRMEDLKSDKPIPLRTEGRINLPSSPGRLFLVRKGKTSIIKKENSQRVLKTLGLPKSADKTTLFWISTPGWELRIDGKRALLEHTDQKHVRMLRLKNPEKVRITVRHYTEINTATGNSGWIDGLHFTYGSPAATIPGWADAAIQIGSLVLSMLLMSVLVCMVFSALFNSNRILPRGIRTAFRISATRIMATLIFITLVQLPFLGLLQGNILLAGGGILLFIMIPVLLILAARISPALFIAQLEGLSPWQSILRSFQLTGGHTRRFFLVISAVLFTLILFLNLAGTITAEILGTETEAVTSVMTTVINGRTYIWSEAVFLFLGTMLILILPLIPVITHLLYSLYIDTRIRKEGLEGAPAETLLQNRRGI